MDQLIYEDGKIRITQNVFMNGRGDNYVVASIRGIRELQTGKSVKPLLMGLALLIWGGWQKPFPYSDYVLGGAGLLLAALYFASRPTYRILLVTPAGEGEAFSTKDEIQHKNVLTCLRRAVALHQN